MSAATPRTISNAPDLRQLLAAVGALILAVALLVAVTISRQASVGTTSAPAAVPASGAYDHGWSSAAGSQDLVVSTGNGGLVYTGIPYAAPDTITGIVPAPRWATSASPSAISSRSASCAPRSRPPRTRTSAFPRRAASSSRPRMAGSSTRASRTRRLT